jgi:hypothetical protein
MGPSSQNNPDSYKPRENQQYRPVEQPESNLGFKTPENPLKFDTATKEPIEEPSEQDLVLHSNLGVKEEVIPLQSPENLAEQLEKKSVHAQNLETLLEHSGNKIMTDTADIYESVLGSADETAGNPDIV